MAVINEQAYASSAAVASGLPARGSRCYPRFLTSRRDDSRSSNMGCLPQQVQNYAVTRTTLYALDGARRREIPLDEIDLPQTEKTNRDAGARF